MPSRRQILAAACSTGLLSGCSALASEPPSVSEQPCPPGGFVRSTASCSHTDAAENGVEVSLSSRTLDSEQKMFDFTISVRNRGDGPIEFESTEWELWRNSGPKWARLSDANTPTESAGSSRSDGTVRTRPGRAMTWTGLRTMFDAFDDEVQSGLYAAVIPATRQETTIDCVAVFRIAVD